MTIRRDNVQADSVGPEKLTKSFREARYGFEPFCQQPLPFSVTAGDGSAPTGTTGNQNGISTGYNNFVWTVLGTQTIVAPVMTTDGSYDFGLDQTLNDGWELLVSGNNTATTGGNSPAHYTMGTDECFVRLVFQIEDISGANLMVGFRKVAAFAADYEDYTDLSAIQVLGDNTSAAGAVNVIGILNNAATDSDATGDTVADATETEFLVKVTGRVATWFINGAAPSTTPSTFTFDSGDIIMPFVHFTHTTDVAGEVKLARLEWGLLADYNNSTLGTP